MKKWIIVLGALFALLFAGCTGNGGNFSPEGETVKEPEMLSYEMYYGDENAESFLSVTVRTNIIAPDAVAMALVGQGVLAEEVRVNSLELREGQLHLDFNEAFLEQLGAMGTAGERMLMGSVVNTFLDAFDAETVVITVDGRVPESGHMVYDAPIGFME